MAGTMTTGSAGLSAEVREHYDKRLLYVAKPKLVHDKYLMDCSIPVGEGKITHWRGFARLDVDTTPLTEGVTPAASQMSVRNVQVTVEQYGRYFEFSDRVVVQSIDKVLDAGTKLLGINSGETFDIIAREALNAGTSVRYASPRVSRITVAAGDVITDLDIKKCRRDLERNLTPFFSASGDDYFVALVHPDVYLDLMSTDGYKLTGQYSDPKKIYTGQVVMLYGILFKVSTQCKIFTGAGAAGIDVYSTLFFGDQAAGKVDIDQLGLEMIYKSASSGGTSDPMNQRQTQAWKGTYAAKITNENFILRYESAATTLA